MQISFVANLPAGQYGHVFDQLEVVAAQLAAIPELKNGFDALGFSQGMVFFCSLWRQG